jgi:tetratricopeptide (TPR) repeat protein
MEKSDCYPEVYALFTNGEVERAMELCRKPPCSESIDCQRFLGREYYRKGLMEDALEWYARVAEQGDRTGHYGMGCVYFSKANYSRAMHFFERAADESFPLGFYGLGYLYDQGLGVQKDSEKAVGYFRKGAAQGHFGCRRALIERKLRSQRLFVRLSGRLELLGQALKGFLIALRNVNDPRLSGFPNALEEIRVKRNNGSE